MLDFPLKCMSLSGESHCGFVMHSCGCTAVSSFLAWFANKTDNDPKLLSTYLASTALYMMCIQILHDSVTFITFNQRTLYLVIFYFCSINNTQHWHSCEQYWIWIIIGLSYIKLFVRNSEVDQEEQERRSCPLWFYPWNILWKT